MTSNILLTIAMLVTVLLLYIAWKRHYGFRGFLGIMFFSSFLLFIIRVFSKHEPIVSSLFHSFNGFIIFGFALLFIFLRENKRK